MDLVPLYIGSVAFMFLGAHIMGCCVHRLEDIASWTKETHTRRPSIIEKILVSFYVYFYTINATIAIFTPIGFLLYAVGFILKNSLYDYYQKEILCAMSKPVFIVPLPVVAVLFFKIRQRYPAIYGLLEILGGIFALQNLVTVKSDDAFAKWVILLGGVYIMVRGLDSIDKDKKLPSYLRRYWDKAFSKQSLS